MTTTIPVNTGLLAEKLEEKRRRTGKRSAMALNCYQTRPDPRTGLHRLVWAPPMGDHEEKRGIKPNDPEFMRLVADSWLCNSLANDGEEYLLDVGFRGATAKTNIYGTLWNDTPADTDDPSTLTGEPSGNGYAALTYACNGTDFPTLALDSGDFQMTGLQKSFTASGGSIGPVTYFCFLDHATNRTATELLINYVALSATRTILDGDSLNVTPSIKLA